MQVYHVSLSKQKHREAAIAATVIKSRKSHRKR